jgi:hypothetical protein
MRRKFSPMFPSPTAFTSFSRTFMEVFTEHKFSFVKGSVVKLKILKSEPC